MVGFGVLVDVYLRAFEYDTMGIGRNVQIGYHEYNHFPRSNSALINLISQVGITCTGYDGNVLKSNLCSYVPLYHQYSKDTSGRSREEQWELSAQRSSQVPFTILPIAKKI